MVTISEALGQTVAQQTSQDGTAETSAHELTSGPAQTTEPDPSSFVSGTCIATLKGEVPVESLKVGDRVVTRSVGALPLRWIGSRKAMARGSLAPVMIKAGTFGNHEDMLVSQDQGILVTDPKAELYFGTNRVLVPARHLVDGFTVFPVEGGEVTYWYLMFDRHQIVYADGAMAESFYPSAHALGQIGSGLKSDLLDKFPALMSEGYGRSAGRLLNEWEARVLMDGRKQPVSKTLTIGARVH